MYCIVLSCHTNLCLEVALTIPPKLIMRDHQKEKWEEKFEVRFQQLVDYKQVHCNCNVPRKYKANPQLGSWVDTQRKNQETMSENRRNQLNSIGFTWKILEANIWGVRFQQLVEYKRVQMKTVVCLLVDIIHVGRRNNNFELY